MFVFNADKNNLTITGNDLMTSGSVNVNKVQFVFSKEWDGLEKRAIFSTMIDGKSLAYELVIGEADTYFLPWELFVSKDNTIYGGVYGYNGDTLVMPTERKRIGVVKESVLDPNAIPSVPWEPGEDPDSPSDSSGDHRRLTHRDSEDQHPMSSITGLSGTVDKLATRPITNSELEAILT